MSRVVVSYHCGCGFKSDKLDQAIAHCNEKGHTLDITGRIYPTSESSPKSPDIGLKESR